MKNRKSHILISALFSGFLLMSSCVDPESDREVQTTQQQPDDKPGLDNIGGRPEQSLAPVKGIFHSPTQNCTSGFGLCPVEILPGEQVNVPVDTLAEGGERLIDAVFILSTDEPNTMRIEFYERVPYFENTFVVGNQVGAYQGLFGYESVRPIPGSYPADPKVGQYGSVTIQVERIGNPQ